MRIESSVDHNSQFAIRNQGNGVTMAISLGIYVAIFTNRQRNEGVKKSATVLFDRGFRCSKLLMSNQKGDPFTVCLPDG